MNHNSYMRWRAAKDAECQREARKIRLIGFGSLTVGKADAKCIEELAAKPAGQYPKQGGRKTP